MDLSADGMADDDAETACDEPPQGAELPSTRGRHSARGRKGGSRRRASNADIAGRAQEESKEESAGLIAADQHDDVILQADDEEHVHGGACASGHANGTAGLPDDGPEDAYQPSKDAFSGDPAASEPSCGGQLHILRSSHACYGAAPAHPSVTQLDPHIYPAAAARRACAADHAAHYGAGGHYGVVEYNQWSPMSLMAAPPSMMPPAPPMMPPPPPPMAPPPPQVAPSEHMTPLPALTAPMAYAPMMAGAQFPSVLYTTREYGYADRTRRGGGDLGGATSDDEQTVVDGGGGKSAHSGQAGAVVAQQLHVQQQVAIHGALTRDSANQVSAVAEDNLRVAEMLRRGHLSISWRELREFLAPRVPARDLAGASSVPKLLELAQTYGVPLGPLARRSSIPISMRCD